MAIGTFGNIRPADVSINDIDVFYTYAPDRESLTTEVFRLEATDVLTELNTPTDEQVAGTENLLGGLYNLRLPSETFSNTGIYMIYIRPKVIRTTIVDCGVLSALPTVKGVILDTNDPALTDLDGNNVLQGYKIEYQNSDGSKLRNVVRYVVTSNKVIPVTENIGNTSQTSVRYRFDDAGTLLFLQLTPSSASNVKPNVTPFIGVPNQTIFLSNTNFNPIAIEVELTENSIDTVVNLVGGEQIRDVQKGIVTYYDRVGNERVITRQYDLYEIDDDVTDQNVYEVKERRDNIDTSQDFDDITNP
jgi:hypothetical protein